MNFYSEYGEDRWIAENLKLPDRGFYVDVGCAVPGSGSNTAFLRDRGWGGLVIDANPAYAALWRAVPNVVFLTAIVSDSPIVSFAFKTIPGHSRAGEGRDYFAAQRLDRIIERLNIKQIDFLSVDVEGYEFEVLSSLINWKGLRAAWPKVIVSEFSTAGLPDDFRVFNSLTEIGYREMKRTHSNHIFELAP